MWSAFFLRRYNSLTSILQLFFFDAGASKVPGQAITAGDSSDEGDELSRRSRPAWEDSDDERITVSLASVPRLRKLRKEESEDVVTGRQYIKRLRQQFERLYPTPEWAIQGSQKPPKKKRRTSASSVSDESATDEDIDMDDDSLSAQPLAKLLQRADSLTAPTAPSSTTQKRKLKPEVISIQRTKDIQTSGPSTITSLQIHPTLPLLLSSGGAAGLLSLYDLTPTPHSASPPALLTTLQLRGTSLATALFTPDARDPRILLGGRRRYFHAWDLASGRVAKVTRVYGQARAQRTFERLAVSRDGAHVAVGGAERRGGAVGVLGARSLQWVAQARVEARGGLAGFTWWRDGRGLTVVGRGGEVAEWDLREGKVVARWRDEGAVGTTVLAMGGSGGPEELGGDRWVAIGSTSGIVNVYDRRSWSGEASEEEKSDNASCPRNPKPKRALDQLTTPISHLEFSPDGQLLCMASRWKRDSLRLVHLPSCTVYRNWPTSQTPLGRISAVAFGEVSGELTLIVGNEAGKIRGWEIRE